MSLLAVGLLEIGFVVAGAGAGAGSASAPHTRVFLHAMPGPQVERRCLKTLFDEFSVDAGKTKGLETTGSRAKADVVAEVEECVVTDSPRRGGVVEVGHAGHDAGTTDTVGLSLQSGTGGVVGRVTLTAEIDGVKKTFASGSDALPIEDAAHAATKPLLEWVAGRPHADAP
jgi:hypothetical protein